MGKGGVWNPNQRSEPSIDPDDCELPKVACELPSSGFTFLLERPQHISASVDVPLSQGVLISSSNSISTVNMDSFLSSAEYLNAMIWEEASQSESRLRRTSLLEDDPCFTSVLSKRFKCHSSTVSDGKTGATGKWDGGYCDRKTFGPHLHKTIFETNHFLNGFHKNYFDEAVDKHLSDEAALLTPGLVWYCGFNSEGRGCITHGHNHAWHIMEVVLWGYNYCFQWLWKTTTRSSVMMLTGSCAS